MESNNEFELSPAVVFHVRFPKKKEKKDIDKPKLCNFPSKVIMNEEFGKQDILFFKN